MAKTSHLAFSNKNQSFSKKCPVFLHIFSSGLHSKPRTLNITSLLLDHMDFLDQFIWPLMQLCQYLSSLLWDHYRRKYYSEMNLFSLLNRCIWKYFFTHDTSYFYMQKIHSPTWMVMVSNRTITKPLNKRGPFPISSHCQGIRLGFLPSVIWWIGQWHIWPKLKFQFDLYFHLMMDFGNVIMINMGRKCALNN